MDRIITGGGDLGNRALKLVLAKENGHLLDKPFKMTLSNAVKMVSKGFQRGDMGESESVEKSLDVIIRCGTAEKPFEDHPLHNKRFFVGALAVRNGEMQTSTNRFKAHNPYLLVPLLTALALQGEGKEDEIVYRLVVPMPVEEYKDKENKRIPFQNLIQGEYEVEFVTTTGRQGWKTKIQLTIGVNAEGLTALYNHMYDYKGNILHDWRGESVGGLDLGAFTFDIPVLMWDFEKKRHIPDITLSRGIQKGVYTAYDGIILDIKTNFGVTISRQSLEEYIITKNFIMPLGSKDVSIKDLADEHLTIAADEIGYNLVDMMNMPKTSEIKRFLAHGGGVISLSTYLIPYISKIRSELLVSTDPVYETAEGCAKLAVMVFREG